MRKMQNEVPVRKSSVLKLSDSDWREVLQGGVFVLERGADYHGKSSTAATEVRETVRQQVGWVKCTEEDDRIVVRMYPPEGNQR